MDTEIKDLNIEEVEGPEKQTDVALEEINVEPIAHAQPRRNDPAVNLRELRAAKIKAEKEKEELRSRLAFYENKEQEKESTYGDDDFVEGKHLKKEVESVRAQMLAQQQLLVAQADESRLRTKYSDFDKVINSETIELLKESDPEFAETIATSTGSLYSRGVSTYKRIKELGLYVEDTHKENREKAQYNASKPRSLNSVSPQQGDSPLSQANAFASGLTPELKQKLWQEMQDSIK